MHLLRRQNQVNYGARLKKSSVVLFHDESTFQANEDQPTFWGIKGTTLINPKSKGSGIMVSDFIDEKMDTFA